jgi:hypothetical protein
MNSLRDFYLSLSAADRAVVWIALLLAAAIATVFTALQPDPASIGLSPDITAPPFELQFAAVTR